jgi:hypothetical protein
MKDLRRFVYLPDLHGEHADAEAVRVALDFIADFKPHRRIIGGDVWDFAPLRKGADESEKRASLAADMEAGLDLLHRFKATDHCLGNHDVRPWRMRDESTGAMRDYAQILVDQIGKAHDRLKCRTYGYRIDQRCQLGPQPGLKAIHGFAHSEHTAKTTALAYQGTTMAGHTHHIAYYRAASMDLRECYVVGCMRHPIANYNQTRYATFRHTVGFAWGYYSETEPIYTVNQAQRMSDGRWILNGKGYR